MDGPNMETLPADLVVDRGNRWGPIAGICIDVNGNAQPGDTAKLGDAARFAERTSTLTGAERDAIARAVAVCTLGSALTAKGATKSSAS